MWLGIDPGIKSLSVVLLHDKKVLFAKSFQLVSRNARRLKLTERLAMQKKLYAVLTQLDADITKLSDNGTYDVAIEYQMSQNKLCRTVADCCAFYFIERHNVVWVMPCEKFKVESELSLATFMEQYVSKYVARKKYALAAFKAWLDKTNQNVICEKKYSSDIADAFLVAATKTEI